MALLFRAWLARNARHATGRGVLCLLGGLLPILLLRRQDETVRPHALLSYLHLRSPQTQTQRSSRSDPALASPLLPGGGAMSHADSHALPLVTAAPPKTDILRGWIKTTRDALLVLQATRVGIVPRVTRRFHELEKRSIIQSGAVFVFTEEESGIKRWTDPYLWSASRMQGSFLVSMQHMAFLYFQLTCTYPRCIANGKTSMG